MKKILYFLLFFCGIAQAQTVTIPDANFKNKLLLASTSNGIAKDANGTNIVIDSNSDGEIQFSEALDVYELRVFSSNIQDLTGIEAFTNLTYLRCDDNQLSELNIQNLINLTYLSCGINQLDELNVQTLTNLTSLQCGGNNLTELDLSNNPNLVDYLFIGFNPLLSYVNVKNGSTISNMPVGDGNWEEIWGNLPDNCYVCADAFEIADIEPYLNIWGTSGKHVSSYCTFYPGGNYNTVSGTLLFDSNADGICDGNDLLQPFIKINITDGIDENSAFTDASGNYIFYTQDGTYTLSLELENPGFFDVTPPQAVVTFPLVDNSTETEDFCITANGIHPDLEVVIAPIMAARPGFEAIYKIVYRNKGNQVLSQVNGISFLYEDDFMDFVSASATPDSQSVGSLSWDYVDLMPFEHRSIIVTMDINPPTDPNFPVNIDDVFAFTAEILPLGGDEDPTDNTYVLNQTVVGAYDPNDITCIEGEVVTPQMIGEELHYLIRFENTGNFAAENVVVTMEIDPDHYDVSSLKILESSHNLNARTAGNTAEFFFEEIQLQSGGHGNILLVMETNTNLSEGDFVMSTADIYFDYNSPVITNDAVTVFEANMDIQDNLLSTAVSISPNPVYDRVTIISEAKITSIEWYDLAGRLVRVSLINGFETTQNLSSLPSAIYIAKIHTGQGILMQKIIKE